MDSRAMSFVSLLIIVSSLSPIAKAETSSSVFFIDASPNQYIQSPSNDVVQKSPMLLTEVGAAVSVLLGIAPSASLSAAGSSKLNEVLTPNPFNRPRAVFALEISGVRDADVISSPYNAMFKSATQQKVDVALDKAKIQLPDRDEVSLVHLDQLSTDDDITDEDITEFAQWFGGSYDIDATKPVNGELTVPLASGASLKLNMSKKEERQLVTYLVALVNNARRAIKMHEDLSKGSGSPAELLIGQFDFIKAMKEQYGSDGILQQQAGLVLATISKIFESLQTAYKGQIVGVIFFSETAASGSEKLLDISFTSHPAPRWLEEKKGSSAATIIGVLLVRQVLAWVTGILLLIATLFGLTAADIVFLGVTIYSPFLLIRVEPYVDIVVHMRGDSRHTVYVGKVHPYCFIDPLGWSENRLIIFFTCQSQRILSCTRMSSLTKVGGTLLIMCSDFTAIACCFFAVSMAVPFGYSGVFKMPGFRKLVFKEVAGIVITYHVDLVDLRN